MSATLEFTYMESGKKKGHIGGRYISIEDIDERLEKIEE